MKSKIDKLFLMSVLFVIMFSFVNLGYSDDLYNLEAHILKYEPAPARPNSYIDVWVELANNGNKEATNIELKVEDMYPFSIDYGYDRSYNISSIPASMSAVKKFHVRVDKDATDGMYNLKVIYVLKDDGFEVERELPIQVKNYESILDVSDINVSGSFLVIGKENYMYFDLVNNANSQLKDITVSLDLTNTPIHTYGMTNKKKILVLDSKEKRKLSYDLIVDPDAEPGIYMVSFNLEYYDSEGNKITDVQKTSLIVGEEPVVLVEKNVEKVLEKNKVENIELNIINSGNSKVKYVRVYVEGDKVSGGKLLSSEWSYLGNIDSDDYETLDLKIMTDDKDNLEIPLRIEFEDELNRKHVLNKEVSFRLYSSMDLERMGLKSKDTTYIYVVAVLLIIAGYFGYRKFRKHRRKREE